MCAVVRDARHLVAVSECGALWTEIKMFRVRACFFHALYTAGCSSLARPVSVHVATYSAFLIFLGKAL